MKRNEKHLLAFLPIFVIKSLLMTTSILFVISVIVGVFSVIFLIKGLKKKQDIALRTTIFFLSIIYFIYMVSLFSIENSNEHPLSTNNSATKKSTINNFNDLLKDNLAIPDTIIDENGDIFVHYDDYLSFSIEDDKTNGFSYYDVILFIPFEINSWCIYEIDLNDSNEIEITIFAEWFEKFPKRLEIHNASQKTINFGTNSQEGPESNDLLYTLSYKLRKDFNVHQSKYFFLCNE